MEFSLVKEIAGLPRSEKESEICACAKTIIEILAEKHDFTYSEAVETLELSKVMLGSECALRLLGHDQT